MDLALDHRRWTTHPARMRFPRRDFGLVSVGERLFAIGGEGDTAGQCDDSVDEYNEASGNWDKLASLPTSLKGYVDGGHGSTMMTSVACDCGWFSCQRSSTDCDAMSM